MKNLKLVKAFEALMARNGKPITPITPTAQRQRGRPEQIYRMANGQTVRVRTNQAPALMSKPAGYKKGKERPVDAPLTFEPNDFVGIIFPIPGQTDRARAYLLASKQAAKTMKADMKAWMESDPKHSRKNRTFVISFDNSDNAAKWSDDCLGEIDLDGIAPPELTPEPRVATPLAKTVGALIERHQREIADALGLVPEAVGITINLVYQDRKKGDLRTTIR